MKPKAMFVVQHRTRPKVAVVVSYSETTGKRGKVLASEPIQDNFTNADLISAARRLVPQVPHHDVILPVGVDL